MIKNNNQLTQAKRMLEKYIQQKNNANPQELAEKMRLTSLICRIQDIQQDIEYYESLLHNSGKLEFDSESIAKAIISLRIASGYTQKELAEKIGVPEQQIQRYEQQDYSKVKLERIIQIMRVLSSKINLSFQIKGLGKIIPIDQGLKDKRNQIQKRGYFLNFGK